MNNLFIYISKYFWLLAIGISIINYFFLITKSKKQIEQNPELEEGYNKLSKHYFFWNNIPWIIMGIGMTIGKVPSVWYYFRPKDGNLYVIAWFITIFILWILGTFWIFFKNGAETLIKYPGLINTNFKKTIYIKLFWILSLFGGILGVTFMWIMNPPIPNF